MKRIASILFLPVFLFGMIGYFPVFKLQQWQIHEQVEDVIKKSVPENQLEVISVSAENANEFSWDWDGKEFSYKGKMYDVVRTEKTKNAVRYFCVSDEKETGLYAQLGEMVKKQMNDENSSSGNSAKNLVKMILQIYIPSKQIALLPNSNDNSFNSFYKISCASYVSETNSPPPKFFI